MEDMKEIKTIESLHNHSESYIVVESFPEIDYVLIHRNTKFMPWIAVWAYNEERECWGQGHYFTELVDAMEYIGKKLTKKTGRDEPKIEDDGCMERKGEGYEVQWYNNEGDNDRVVRCSNVQALAQYLSRCMWGDVETTNNPTIWYNGKPWCRYEYTGIDEESY